MPPNQGTIDKIKKHYDDRLTGNAVDGFNLNPKAQVPVGCMLDRYLWNGTFWMQCAHQEINTIRRVIYAIHGPNKPAQVKDADWAIIKDGVGPGGDPPPAPGCE